MKKLVILLLIMSFLFSIVACAAEAVITTEIPETSRKPTVITKPVGETVKKPQDTVENPFEGTEGPVVTTQNPSGSVTVPTTTVQEIPEVPSPTEYPKQLDGIHNSLEDTTVQFIYVEGDSGTYTADSIWVDAESASYIDAVDQQILDRNNRIYEDLGITIEAFTDPTLGIASLQSFAKTYFDVQDPGLDVYAGYQYFDLKVALTGSLLNLNTIVNENGKTVIDTTRGYWATNYINSMTYNDQMYWVTGDLALRYTGGLYCTFVNLDLYDMYVKNNYEGKSIYDIVNEKKWTMQTMLDMADMVDDDTDGSGTASANDRLGIVFEPNDCLDALAFGCKINFTTRTTQNGQDMISIALNTDLRAVKLANYIHTMFNSVYAYQANSSDSFNMMSVFAEGNTLFAVNKIYQASAYLARMDRFAIIPTPLLDKDQGNYGSGVHDGVTVFGVSKYSNCPIASAATLELMAYYGSLLVTPTYVDSVLKGSEARYSTEALAMIDIIRAGGNTDFGAAWSDNLSGIAHIFRSKDAVAKFSSYVQVTSRRWPEQLKTLLDMLDALAEQ